MYFFVNTQSLRDAAAQTRSQKDNVYLRQLHAAQDQVRQKAQSMVPAGAEGVLREQIALIMSKAHKYAGQIDAHCNYLIAAAGSYEVAENALMQQADSLPVTFGWRG